eukprot:c5766_g1_i1.p1 GENE.c5766_g1_i1~~c5766_g1_i1.p1  ORF type:complete len:229 (-),score=53.43 c5766_g1_i1:177-818(-)
MATNPPPLPNYEVFIPAQVRPGMMFEVLLPDQSRVKVVCPANYGPGDRFEMRPFRVTIPPGLFQGSVFTALVQNIPIPVSVPSGRKPGDTLTIYGPVFDDSRKSQNSKVIDQGKMEEYMKKHQSDFPQNILQKAMDIDSDAVPNDFKCPISHEIMLNPVVAMDGHTYESTEIEKWFNSHDTSPKTNEKIPAKFLVPNHTMRAQIIEFVEKYNI